MASISEALSQSVAQKLAHAMLALNYHQPTKLIELLNANLSGKVSEEALNTITPKRWRAMASKLEGNFTRNQLDSAYTELTRVGDREAPPSPQQDNLEGQPIYVGITSNNGEEIDGHFGSCLRILIYKVTDLGFVLKEVREVDSDAKGEERAQYLVSLIDDCHILFTLSIGGPAAAKVTRAKVHPIKVKSPEKVSERLGELSDKLKVGYPRWIKSA
ncbi:dinitrogenase iron-molybdenum cofactor [Vibrio astriarenae]|uniref:Dinitrogenase iron-molybdenum cofactor n=1 Tax=Vibrio astriarenae TaxID=1481923 RepID=A0A7Z2YDC2_9VIBR|nr:NifB/NifX family molybdenum-iron cluster-binding protein [Vibrio astriarenae]QIA63152.1 dinitrogenase iron-molybdenum cofactor [Vibrio astriarenae]